MAIYCLSSVTGAVQLAGLDWFCGKGHRDPNCPSLAVCFDNGRAQLMKYELDPGKIEHNYCIKCLCCYIRVYCSLLNVFFHAQHQLRLTQVLW